MTPLAAVERLSEDHILADYFRRKYMRDNGSTPTYEQVTVMVKTHRAFTEGDVLDSLIGQMTELDLEGE